MQLFYKFKLEFFRKEIEEINHIFVNLENSLKMAVEEPEIANMKSLKMTLGELRARMRYLGIAIGQTLRSCDDCIQLLENDKCHFRIDEQVTCYENELAWIQKKVAYYLQEFEEHEESQRVEVTVSSEQLL